MATYQSGGVRRATANSRTAAANSAEKRRCPKCQRKSALRFISDEWQFGSACRWCDYVDIRQRDTDIAPRPTEGGAA